MRRFLKNHSEKPLNNSVNSVNPFCKVQIDITTIVDGPNVDLNLFGLDSWIFSDLTGFLTSDAFHTNFRHSHPVNRPNCVSSPDRINFIMDVVCLSEQVSCQRSK